MSQLPNKQKSIKPFVIGAAVVLTIAFMFYIHVKNDTTMFMEHRASDGHLPAEEFVLSRQDTGKPTQDIRTLTFNNIGATADSNDNKYVTSRGIGPGSTWQEFVDAYGDVEMKDIQVATKEIREDGTSLLKGYTPRTFDEKFVKSGQVVPGEDIMVIRFSFYTNGDKVWYSDAELRQYYEGHAHTNSTSISEYVLTITFEPVNENDDTVYWISSEKVNRLLSDKIR